MRKNTLATAMVAGLAGVFTLNAWPSAPSAPRAHQPRFGGGPNRKAGDAKKARRKNEQKGRRAARGK